MTRSGLICRTAGKQRRFRLLPPGVILETAASTCHERLRKRGVLQSGKWRPIGSRGGRAERAMAGEEKTELAVPLLGPSTDGVCHSMKPVRMVGVRGDGEEADRKDF